MDSNSTTILLEKYSQLAKSFQRLHHSKLRRTIEALTASSAAALLMPLPAVAQCTIINQSIDLLVDYSSAFTSTVTGTGGTTYKILGRFKGFDVDGVPGTDFRMTYYWVVSSMNMYIAGRALLIDVGAANSNALALDSVSSTFVSAINTGDPIDSANRSFFTSTFGVLLGQVNYPTFSINLGKFRPIGTTANIGIRIGNGPGNFGFIQLTLNSPHSFTIVAAGVNQQNPGQTIIAGDCASLPVELTSFQAKAGAQSIQLNWETQTEQNNAGFEIQRAERISENEKDIKWKKIGFVEGKGTTLEPQDYRFDDKTARKGQSYLYRLQQIDFDGSFTFSETVSATIKAEKLEVSEVFPNPVATEVPQVQLALPQAAPLESTLFDIYGKIIRTDRYELSEGSHTLPIKVENLAAGTYFVKLETRNESVYRKIVIQ